MALEVEVVAEVEVEAVGEVLPEAVAEVDFLEVVVAVEVEALGVEEDFKRTVCNFISESFLLYFHLKMLFSCKDEILNYKLNMERGYQCTNLFLRSLSVLFKLY